MEKSKILIIVALVIGVLALGNSIISSVKIKKVAAKVTEMGSAVNKLQQTNAQLEKLLPLIDTLNKVIPRLQQLQTGPAQ